MCLRSNNMEVVKLGIEKGAVIKKNDLQEANIDKLLYFLCKF